MSVSIKDWSHSQILPLAFTITASISLGENIFQASCRVLLHFIRMGLPLIFILGHSFIRRLDNFVAANPNLNHQFLLTARRRQAVLAGGSVFFFCLVGY